MDQELYYLSWQEVEQGAKNILEEMKQRNIHIDTIVPVLRGGAPLGSLLSNNMDADISYLHVRRSQTNLTNSNLGEPILKGITNEFAIEGKDILIVDDMLDRGVTMNFVIEQIQNKWHPKSIHIAVLYNFVQVKDKDKYLVGLTMNEKKWIVFPWETKID